MSIVELIKQGKFVVTAEIGPPKGVDIQEMLETAEVMRGRVDAINATDQQSSAMRLGSLATCCILKQKGLEPVFQVTCPNERFENVCVLVRVTGGDKF